MSRRIRARSADVLLFTVLLAALIAGPLPAAGRGPITPAVAPQAPPADLAAALGADGTFRGNPSVSGAVDTSRWTLTSNLAAGEPPRFAPIGPDVATPVGPWSALGSNGTGNGALWNGFGVWAVAVSGNKVYVGGSFENAAGIPEADDVAMWNGHSWSALGSNGYGDGAIDYGAGLYVFALAVSGTDLYVGGRFFNAANLPKADMIAKWNGTTWSALGSNGADGALCCGRVNAIAVSGTNLYVGGDFGGAAGIATADNIALWNGTTWSALGSNGGGDGALNAYVAAVAISGANLYVGGAFSENPGTRDYIAMWNGSVWSALGSNGSGNGALNSTVWSLAVSGTNLYVGGNFVDAAGNQFADHIAKWNGSSWSALGSDGVVNGALNWDAWALVVFGTDLYVGGGFSNARLIPEADYVAKWNGSTWSALGSNGAGDGALNSPVHALRISGCSLYVGGDFGDAAGVATADRIAKWALAGGCKPDGRIQLGGGALVGDNVYNTTGLSQNRTGSAAPAHSITFGISIQNDGTVTDKFKVKATGAAASAYTVKYFRGTTDITAAVVGGTYQTASLAPGGTALITAKVTVKSTAAVGSSVTRLLTISSVGNSAMKDAVKFIGKRA